MHLCLFPNQAPVIMWNAKKAPGHNGPPHVAKDSGQGPFKLHRRQHKRIIAIVS